LAHPFAHPLTHAPLAHLPLLACQQFLAREVAVAVGIEIRERRCIRGVSHRPAVGRTLRHSLGTNRIELGLTDEAVAILVVDGKRDWTTRRQRVFRVGRERHDTKRYKCRENQAST
jgi:hypothetical protein